ncbi:antitoxin [Gemmatimonas sp.]|uniref:antitoxin n=1 Tax=Gemmatimonas sp. TaxID=1962908 RepID=UPI003567772D
MTQRLQVLLDDEEFAEIRRVAEHQRLTVAEWVRQALRTARQHSPAGDPRRKLSVVREAAQGAYPVGELPSMLEEIESGYLLDDLDAAPGSGE